MRAGRLVVFGISTSGKERTMAIRAKVFSPTMMVLVVLTLMPGAPAPAVPAAPDHAPAAAAQAQMAPAPLGQDEAATQARLERAFGHLPLYFVENQGQMDERVAYYIQGSDKMIYFTPEGVTFALAEGTQMANRKSQIGRSANQQISKSANRYSPFRYLQQVGGSGVEAGAIQRWTVKLEFIGANPGVRPVGEEQQEAVISYFKGQPDEWRTGLPTYSRLVYRDLWPGIDLVYYGTVDRLKYEFIVHPGADPGQIRLAYRGATGVAVNAAGQLEVGTPIGGFADDSPVAYQEIDGQRVAVDMAYQLANDESQPGGSPLAIGHAQFYGFSVGPYDRSHPLVIDPVVLVYCGYIGGSDGDAGRGIAVDRAGNAYVVGYTFSTEADGFPVRVGPDLTYNGAGVFLGGDVFVAKVNTAGTGLVYAGYIGGSDGDDASGIAVDGAGNAYVVGSTGSTEAEGFPVVVGPDLTHNGGSDAFVAKVNAAGTALAYCGYIGGSGDDSGHGIAVDGAGNAYVVGSTNSSEGEGFPVTVGPDLTYNGNIDAFVAKVATICFISGRVTDAGSNPITDVLVLADAGLNTTTNASGYYTLTTILTGAYILTPTLNGASFWPVTRTVTITSADVSGQDFTGVIAPIGVIITGPLTGTVGLFYTFTAAIRPVTTTMPITYTWALEPVVGQGTAVAAYSWTLPGTQTLTVTVTNAGGAVMATHAIELKSLVFLPLVLRKQ